MTRDIDGSLLATLYQTLDDLNWPRFLEHLGRVLPSLYASLSIVDIKHQAWSGVHLWGLNRDELTEYTTKWQDPWLAKVDVARLQEGEATLSHLVCSDDELEATDAYRSFLGPRQFHYGAALLIERSPERQVVLSVARSKQSGRLGESEVRLFASIAPHIRRVLRVHGEMSAAKRLSHACTGIFEYLSAGLAVLARDGRVLFSNDIWQDSLSQMSGVYDERGFLRFRDRANQKELNRLLLSGSHVPLSLSVSRQDFAVAPARRFVLLPLATSNEGAPTIDEPAAAVLLIDPDAVPVMDQELSRELFGFTQAEALIAANLFEGRSVGETAGKLNLSTHTVRAHLKSIFLKTGTSRQPNLLSLLLRTCRQHGKSELRNTN